MDKRIKHMIFESADKCTCYYILSWSSCNDVLYVSKRICLNCNVQKQNYLKFLYVKVYKVHIQIEEMNKNILIICNVRLQSL